MPTSGLFSVIIPTYNRAHTLPRAIQSVLSQTYSNWELIIVDNYSHDSTSALIETYVDTRIKFYQINNNGVIATSRNYGISKANGEYIAFLDSDDWWTESKLEIGFMYLQKGYDFLYSNFIVVNSTSLKSRIYSQAQLRFPVFYDLLKYGNPIACSSVIVKYTYLELISCFSEDPNLVSCEDFDAWLRIAKHTDNFICIPSADTFYSQGDTNLSSSPIVLISLNTLRHLYFPDINSNIRLPAWLNYGFASGYFKIRNYSLAIKHSLFVILSSLSQLRRPSVLSVFSKSLYIAFLSLVNLFPKLIP